MRVDPEVVEEVSTEVVLQLALDGAIRVSPTTIAEVEREMAIVVRAALLREDARSKFEHLAQELGEVGFDARVRRYAEQFKVVRGRARGLFSVVEEMLRLLRASPRVEVLTDDDALFSKILLVIALLSGRTRLASESGGTGFPPSGTGPAGGIPAEARAWEVRRGETPSEPDPERRERPGPDRRSRKRRN